MRCPQLDNALVARAGEKVQRRPCRVRRAGMRAVSFSQVVAKETQSVAPSAVINEWG